MLHGSAWIAVGVGGDFIINGVHLEGGNSYERIEKLRYKFASSTKAYEGELSVASVIDLIEQQGHTFYSDGRSLAKVYINQNSRRRFIESRADSARANKLLSQPRF